MKYVIAFIFLTLAAISNDLFAGTHPAQIAYSNSFVVGSTPADGCSAYNSTYPSFAPIGVGAQLSNNNWQCHRADGSAFSGLQAGRRYRCKTTDTWGVHPDQPANWTCTNTCTASQFWSYTTNSCATSPTCTPPQVLSTDGTTCVTPPPTCTAGNTTGAGWYETTSSVPDMTYCMNSCTYDLDSVACSGSKCTIKLTNQTGATCTNSTGSPSQTLTPEAQCLKKGQSYGTLNGEVVCVPRATEGAAPTTSQSNGTKTIVENGQTTTINTNTNVSGDTVTTTTTTINPDGSTSTKQETQDTPSYCTQNPYAEQCRQDKAVGEVTSNPNGYTSTSFYTSKYPNGIEGIWQTSKDEIEGSSAGQLIQNLTPNISDTGTAPIWNMDFNLGALGSYGSFSLTPDSSLWFIIRTILIITSLFVARGLIFGG
jgi:hypothetical protein